MTEKRRSTIRDVAVRAGVSRTTVTRVLRGDRYVSAAARRSVEQAARKLRYERNTVVSAVMSHIRRQRVAACRGKLAWLNVHSERDSMRRVAWLRGLYAGVRGRCEQSGYLMEEIWLNDPSMKAANVSDVLQARGVQGIILHGEHPSLGLIDYDRFACAVAMRPGMPGAIHIAGPDLADGMRQAWSALRSRGYERIGLALHEKHDRGTFGAERGAYLVESFALPARRRIPVLMLPRDGQPAPHMRLFGEWVRRHGPDAVICCDENMTAWARALDIDVPGELGLVHLARHPHLTDWAGIDQREEQIGEAAVDLVLGQLARVEQGIPPFQKKVLIKGQWVDGPTVRAAPTDSTTARRHSGQSEFRATTASRAPASAGPRTRAG